MREYCWRNADLLSAPVATMAIWLLSAMARLCVSLPTSCLSSRQHRFITMYSQGGQSRLLLFQAILNLLRLRGAHYRGKLVDGGLAYGRQALEVAQ